METKEKRFEDQPEMGHKARKEAEDFLNRWINDGSKGWPVHPSWVDRYKERFSTPLTICLN
jgi:hypothetical protein